MIVETLKYTRSDKLLNISQIADRAKTTTEQVELILGPMLQLEVPSGAHLTNSARFKLAFEAVRHGALQQAARALSWQEFEAFIEECLQTVGFDTQKGTIIKDESRRWQIDVIAKKSRMILAIDCKHWESPGYDSKLTKAADHQKLALHALIQQMTGRGDVEREGVFALPIILTLFEPRSRLVDGAVVVSVEQFADFLEGVSPFSSELPFIHAQGVAKSSIN
ncbi:restriction endonuclease [Candidatus Bathyarchaeota archaeon]|nr:MAG: restriction endonuclease [Candidatus Bathyarchaeota archaeon]